MVTVNAETNVGHNGSASTRESWATWYAGLGFLSLIYVVYNLYPTPNQPRLRTVTDDRIDDFEKRAGDQVGTMPNPIFSKHLKRTNHVGADF